VTDPRAFVGVATLFDTPPQPWPAAAFAQWLALDAALPVQLRHDVVITAGGVIREVGRVTASTVLDRTTDHPAGLLVLGTLYPGVVGDCVIEDLRVPRPSLPRWALSLGCDVALDVWGRVEVAVPREISLTQSPVFPDALVLAVGAAARTTWDVLIGADPRIRQGSVSS
jgi:hypothetical protein